MCDMNYKYKTFKNSNLLSQTIFLLYLSIFMCLYLICYRVPYHFLIVKNNVLNCHVKNFICDIKLAKQDKV